MTLLGVERRGSTKLLRLLRPNCKVELKSFHFGVAVTTEISGMLKGVNLLLKIWLKLTIIDHFKW